MTAIHDLIARGCIKQVLLIDAAAPLDKLFDGVR